MSDEEYRRLLTALAKKHVIRHRHEIEPGQLHEMLQELQHLRRLTYVAEQAPTDDERLIAVLAQNLIENTPPFDDVLENHGIFDAVTEGGPGLFFELRTDALPAEEVELLREAGCPDPESELLLIVAHANRRLSWRALNSELSAARASRGIVIHAAEAILASQGKQRTDESKVKPRKILTGIGSILTGAVLGTGNLLLATGQIAAPNQGLAYAVMASCAAGVGSLFKGIGELRGE